MLKQVPHAMNSPQAVGNSTSTSVPSEATGSRTGGSIRIFLYTAVDCSHPGGVQAVVESLSTSLQAKGHQVDCVWSAPTTQVVPGKQVIGLHLRPAPTRKRFRRLLHFPSLVRCLLALIKVRPQIVHVHFLTQRAHYFLLLRRLFGYKVVLTLHGSDLLRPWPQDAIHLGRFLRSADAITVVSADLGRKALAYDGVSSPGIRLIANGVDTDYFSPKERPGPAKKTVLQLITVGRLVSVKGHDILLRAFALAQPRVPGLKLCIVGDGEDKKDLLRLARDLGVYRSVEFAGGLDRASIRERLREADIFVLPSRSEGTPVALLEAMASSLPCIATRVGGVEAVLADTGLIVPPEAPELLADAIVKLVSDPELRKTFGPMARECVMARSSATALEQYERVYKDLLGMH